jgi:hypothetical protein
MNINHLVPIAVFFGTPEDRRVALGTGDLLPWPVNDKTREMIGLRLPSLPTEVLGSGADQVKLMLLLARS